MLRLSLRIHLAHLWLFLLSAYRRSLGEVWLAGSLIARGVWYILPFNTLTGLAYTTIPPAQIDSFERWWGAILVSVGLLQLLTLGNGKIWPRLVGLGLGGAAWLFIGLAAHAMNPTAITIPLYFGFVVAYLWRIRETANGR